MMIVLLIMMICIHCMIMYFENGIDGILVGGSAGEFYALDYNEAEQLISDAVQYINHRGNCNSWVQAV